MKNGVPVPDAHQHATVKFDGVKGRKDPVYLLEREPALAINAALATGRPLLVRGDPGVGKTQLARAAAALLGRRFIRFTVNGRTETNELLWTIDHVERLAEAQLAREKPDRDLVALKRFIRPGPLWKAMSPARAENPLVENPPVDESDPGSVLLIDEIDKADTAIPNGLLEALDLEGFDVPGYGRVDQVTSPLIVFTTNRERFLPDAFLRRCWVVELALPESKDALERALQARGTAHLRGADEGELSDAMQTIVEEAATIIAKARLAGGPDERRDRYRPGVAEYIELLRAVIDAKDPKTLLHDLKGFVLNKQGR